MNKSSKLKRVLILNDDETILGIAREVVEGAGYEVIATTEESEAEELLEGGSVDVFVQDLYRGNGAKGGHELFRIMQEDENLRRIPIICMTKAEPTMKLAEYLAKMGVSSAIFLPTLGCFEDLVYEIGLLLASLDRELSGEPPKRPAYRDNQVRMGWLEADERWKQAENVRDFLRTAGRPVNGLQSRGEGPET